MKKRMICLFLTAVMLLGLIPFTSMNVSADEEEAVMTISQDAMDVLKALEGFRAERYWDVKHYSIGYGTYWKTGMPLKVTEEQAEEYLRESVATMEIELRKFIANNKLELKQNQYDALILFTYNFGAGWLSAGGDLVQSIINGDTGNDFIYNMARWCKVDGKPSVGLLQRRLCEADIYLNNIYTNVNTRRENMTYVLFDPTNGVLDVLMQGYDADDPTVVRPVPFKTNYRFLGWYTEKDGGEWITTLDYSTAEMTLYAHWQQGEGKVDAKGNVLGSTASYRYPGASLVSVSVYEKPADDAKVTGTVAASSTVSIVADYVDGQEGKWGKLSTGGWVKLGKAVTDTVITGEQPVKVTVTNSFVNVRVGAGVSHDVVGKLNKGDVITIYKTSLVSGQLWGKFSSGWVALEYTDYEIALENLEFENMPVVAHGVVVANSYLRIRKGPGTGYAQIGQLLPGDEVEIKQFKKVGVMEWARIEQGWVSMDYIQLVEAAPETPENPDTPETPDTPDTPDTPETPVEPEKPSATVLTGVVINTDQLRVRTAAGTGNRELMRLKSGTKVTIYEQTIVNNMPWGRIDQGWVCLNYIKLDVTAENLKNVVTGTVISNSPLNVRANAGTNHPKVAALPKGTEVTVYEATTVRNVLWGRIDQGWVSLEYVELNAALPGITQKPETPETPETPENPETPTEPEETPEGVLYIGKVINADEVRVRSGAGTNNKVVTSLKRNTKVYIYEEKIVNTIPWARIDQGWICMTYIQILPSAEDLANAVKGVVISNSNLNVRSAAGTHNMKVNSLPTGTEVTVYETTVLNGIAWGRIDQGWVCMTYVQLVEDTETPDDTQKPEDTETPDDTQKPEDTEKPEDTQKPVEPDVLPEGALYSGTVINTDELRVRTGAGTGNKEITRLGMGTTVYIYEEKTVNTILWGRTDLGWVCMTYIQINPTAEDLANAVTGVVIAPNGMNVRSKAGAWNQQVGTLATGTEIQIYETTIVNGVSWGRTDLGWVCMTYIQIVEIPEEEDKTEPETPGEGGTTDPETPGEGGTTDPETPGEGGTTDPETPGEGGTTDPETPSEGGTTDPETPTDPEVNVVSSVFDLTHAAYAAKINEAIASTGYELTYLYKESGLEAYALVNAEDTADENVYLIVMFEMAEGSDKVAGVSLVGPAAESNETKGLLRAVTVAAIKVVNPENASGMIDELFEMEPEVDAEGNTMYGMFDDKLMLVYTETPEVADDPATEEDEATPSMAMYMIYAVELVEAE